MVDAGQGGVDQSCCHGILISCWQPRSGHCRVAPNAYTPNSSLSLLMGVNTNDHKRRHGIKATRDCRFLGPKVEDMRTQMPFSSVVEVCEQGLGRSWCVLQVIRWLHNYCCSWYFGFYSSGHLYGIWTVSKDEIPRIETESFFWTKFSGQQLFTKWSSSNTWKMLAILYLPAHPLPPPTTVTSEY